METKKPSKTPTLDKYKIVEIHRQHLPDILKFVDREFEVIYVNLDAKPGAKVVWLK